MKRLPVLVCFICVASFPKHVIGRIGKELASAFRSMANDTPRELDEIKALGFRHFAVRHNVALCRG